MLSERPSGIGHEIKKTVDAVVAQPFTVPGRLLSGEKGAIGNVTRGAMESIVTLPLRVGYEAGKGVLKGAWNLTKFIALNLPAVLLPSWQKERRDVRASTQSALKKLRL